MLTDIKREEIITEAKTWLKTPHKHACRVKGVGVDCAQFMLKVYVNAGLIDEFNVGYYPSDWHFHRNEELYIDWVSKFCEQTKKPKRGDIALFKFGRCVSHGGLVYDDTNVIHSFIKQGVVITGLSDIELKGRLHSCWTLK